MGGTVDKPQFQMNPMSAVAPGIHHPTLTSAALSTVVITHPTSVIPAQAGTPPWAPEAGPRSSSRGRHNLLGRSSITYYV